jgi:hypothetical protein
MKKVLNLSCPYKVTLDTTTFTYTFNTNTNVNYSLAFKSYSSLFDDTVANGKVTSVYSLNLDKLSSQITPSSGIRETVEAILIDFFSNPENVLVYICDLVDGKHPQREVLFSKWYNKSPARHYISKSDAKFGTGSMIFTSILYTNENPNGNLIKSAWEEIQDLFAKP